MAEDEGERSPNGAEFLSRRRNYLGSIKKDLKDLQGARALMGELTQNADDAPGAETVRFEVAPGAFIVWNDGEFSKCQDLAAEVCTWLTDKDHRCDFHSFREVASGDKEARENTTGAFGIGFTSVYQITDRPELFSSGERWVIDETATEAKRIARTSGVETSGTRFVLPWARTQSDMRRDIAQPVVTDERIAELTRELLNVAPELLLFLNQLESLQVVADGRTTTFHCQAEDNVVRITDDAGRVRRWLVLVADMGEAAQQLGRAHPTLIHPKRPTEVRIAIEIDADPAPGSYFVTLPTEQSTELPFSVNGSFFPKPDRKRIRLDDDPEGRWNQAIIDCAAELLASSLEQLTKQVGNQWVVHLLRAAHDLSERVAGGSAERPHEGWWIRLKEALPNQRVVPTITGVFGTISEVWLTNDDDAESPAAPVLAKLGVLLIATDVRSDWFKLTRDAKIGLRQLRLGALTTALAGRQLEAAAPWIETHLLSDEREVFWEVANHLAKGHSSHESRHAASRLPLVPLRTGEIVAPAAAINAQPGERAILIDGGFGAPLVDDGFANTYRELSGLTSTLGALQMATLARDALSGQSVPDSFDPARVLDWFANRSEESALLGRSWFDELPIFPTGDGFQTARDLVLPVEGFNAPLQLGNLFNPQNRQAVVRPFLIQIGIPSLDLGHFCTDLLPKAVEQGLARSALDELLRFLARHLSQIKEDKHARQVLGDLELVPCVDDVVRRGRDLYFGTVDPLVVGQRPIAKDFGGQVVNELFEWLGVGRRPRPSHVVEHCLTFRQPPARHVESVSAVLKHLQDLEEPYLDAHYSALKTERWLPVRGSGEAARPKDVFAVFLEYLFSSQARFLGVKRPVQEQAVKVLDWLGVPGNPPVDLVVKHLLHCVKADETVNSQVWVFLNRNADDPAIASLRGKRSLHVEQRGYVYPSHCFWDSNPFDRHRVLLSPDFRRFQELFDRVGVRSGPDASDVVDVLGEIAAAHGGATGKLLRQDVPVVQSCWVLLDQLVRNGQVSEEQLDELRRTECVLDANEALRRPSEVLYRDSSQISKQLGPAVSARLIARPDNMRAALDAVGVRHLRQALKTEIVDREDRADQSEFKELVANRRHALARVLDGSEDGPYAMLDEFLAHVRVESLYRLVVVERLDITGAPDHPAPSDRAALWVDDRRELLIVEDHTRWPEIAREFALALGISGEDVAHAATPLMNVLRAPSAEDASAELDLLGYYDLGEAIHPDVEEIESAMPVDTPNSPTDAEEEADLAHTEAEQDPSATPSDALNEHGEMGTDGQRPPVVGESTSTPGRGSPSGTDTPAGAAASGASPEARDPAVPKTTAVQKPNRSDSDGLSKRSTLQLQRQRKRLISYVTAGDAGGAEEVDTNSGTARSETDVAAIESVLAFERSMGREPQEMEHSNPGYDIESVEPDGSVRYIEVKGTASAWDDLGVGITSRQYEFARDHREKFWLYVVVVTEAGGSEPYRIQDPTTHIDRYYFDGGWRSAAEQSVARYQELPELTTYADPSQLESPVMLLNHLDGSDTGTWLPCPADCLDQAANGLFAVRIAGETVGLLYRGGVAFAVPADDVQELDPVVVRLADRTDPETDGVLSVRYFGEERSVAGKLVAARLETDTGVPPISIDDLTTIQILGRVVHKQLPQ